MKSVYIITVNDEVLTACSNWRNAYLTMIDRYSGKGHGWIVDSMRHTYLDDNYVWMDPETGEVDRVSILEEMIDPLVPEYGHKTYGPAQGE